MQKKLAKSLLNISADIERDMDLDGGVGPIIGTLHINLTRMHMVQNIGTMLHVTETETHHHKINVDEDCFVAFDTVTLLHFDNLEETREAFVRFTVYQFEEALRKALQFEDTSN